VTVAMQQDRSRAEGRAGFWSAGSSGSSSSSAKSEKLERLQRDLDEIKAVVNQNIEKVIQRGESIETLVERSMDLSAQSRTFHKSATSLNSSRSIFGSLGGALAAVGGAAVSAMAGNGSSAPPASAAAPASPAPTAVSTPPAAALLPPPAASSNSATLDGDCAPKGAPPSPDETGTLAAPSQPSKADPTSPEAATGAPSEPSGQFSAPNTLSHRDLTAVPAMLDSQLQQSDPDGVVRPTIIKPANECTRTRHKTLLSAAEESTLKADDLKNERNEAIDLLDLLTKYLLFSLFNPDFADCSPAGPAPCPSSIGACTL
jgi:hypothetical protein